MTPGECEIEHRTPRALSWPPIPTIRSLNASTETSDGLLLIVESERLT